MHEFSLVNDLMRKIESLAHENNGQKIVLMGPQKTGPARTRHRHACPTRWRKCYWPGTAMLVQSGGSSNRRRGNVIRKYRCVSSCTYVGADDALL